MYIYIYIYIYIYKYIYIYVYIFNTDMAYQKQPVCFPVFTPSLCFPPSRPWG